ncbi:hypothetical protein TrLO_g13488 [Triparma laevis f. longispina]|uniref:Uncharacterized protein n=1 Tax=Triparma laevis f. longispina TaxID=1714387 RepID=A0A9W7AWW3_9STRA|nr:hypothetical protein TrLO_g13488 [Triparma laevis f. longispina]
MFLLPSPFRVILFVFLLLLKEGNGYRTKGTVDTMKSWNFIDRFCFIPHNYESTPGESITLSEASKYGLFQYSFKFPDSLDLRMLIYYKKEGYDSWDEGWERVYVDEEEYPEKALSCSERHYYATAKFRLRAQKNSNLIETQSSKNRVVSGFAYFKSISPKYFFVAVTNCNPSCTCDPTRPEVPCNWNATNGITFCDGPSIFDYEFSFTNGLKLEYKHFGYDEIGCLAIAWIFMIFYVMLVFLVNVTVKNNLKRIDKYHITVKIVVWSVWVSFVSSVLRLYHYMLYSGDGVGNEGARIMSSVLGSLAEILLVMHLILIAKGWTIVRRKISAGGRVKIAAFITVYAVLHVTTTIFGEVFMDKGKIVFVYETPPGIVLQYTRLFAALWFARSINTTMTQFPNNKRRFYRKYAVIFGLWFAWMVLNTWISMSIPDYLRFKFSMAFELCCTFTAHFILTVMYNPAFSAASSFPFHSNASHEVMTGRWNSDVFKKEINRPGIRSPTKRREARNDVFRDDKNGAGWSAPQPTSPSQFADAPGATPVKSIPILQQQQTSTAVTTTLKLSPAPKPTNQYAFSTVAEATGYVRDASDDVSGLLHQLITHLDTLDDAMDDWDDDVGEEMGEVYDDLGREERPWESRRGDERGRHS